jgi:hypothetical protein
VLVFPAYCFFLSNSSVSALSMNTFTAIFLDLLLTTNSSACLFLMTVIVGVSSVLLVHINLLSLVYHDKRLGSLVLDVLEGGEGIASSVLLLHIELLSPVPVNDTLANLLGFLF